MGQVVAQVTAHQQRYQQQQQLQQQQQQQQKLGASFPLGAVGVGCGGQHGQEGAVVEGNTLQSCHEFLQASVEDPGVGGAWPLCEQSSTPRRPVEAPLADDIVPPQFPLD